MWGIQPPSCQLSGTRASLHRYIEIGVREDKFICLVGNHTTESALLVIEGDRRLVHLIRPFIRYRNLDRLARDEVFASSLGSIVKTPSKVQPLKWIELPLVLEKLDFAANIAAAWILSLFEVIEWLGNCEADLTKSCSTEKKAMISSNLAWR